MSLTVGFGGEGEIADLTLEGSLPVVRAQVPDKSAFVCTGVRAEVALVRGQA